MFYEMLKFRHVGGTGILFSNAIVRACDLIAINTIIESLEILDSYIIYRVINVYDNNTFCTSHHRPSAKWQLLNMLTPIDSYNPLYLHSAKTRMMGFSSCSILCTTN